MWQAICYRFGNLTLFHNMITTNKPNSLFQLRARSMVAVVLAAATVCVVTLAAGTTALASMSGGEVGVGSSEPGGFVLVGAGLMGMVLGFFHHRQRVSI